jgi:hypothetical protein
MMTDAVLARSPRFKKSFGERPHYADFTVSAPDYDFPMDDDGVDSDVFVSSSS